MLEKTELLDGKDGKQLEKLLREYQDIKAKLDDLKKLQDETVAQIKALCDHKASYETINYLFKMNERKENDGFDKKGLEKDHPEIFEKYVVRKDGKILVIGEIIEKGERA